MHQLFIATSLQLLLPVTQTKNFSVPRLSIRRNKNPQKLNVIFLDQNRRNYRLYGITSPRLLSGDVLLFYVSFSLLLLLLLLPNQVCETYCFCSVSYYYYYYYYYLYYYYYSYYYTFFFCINFVQHVSRKPYSGSF